MHTPSSLATFDTIYPADSVEFCPCPGYRDYLVCGTYKLEEEKSKDLSDSRRHDVTETEDETTLETRSNVQIRLGKCWLMQVESSGQL